MEWFETWFNSPYYHLLYGNRNQAEANAFMDALLQQLHPNKDSKILDLACGMGRYSLHLASKGFDVTGIDLSENSITEAIKNEQDNLHFYLHDMRTPFRINYFDYVFNLFTSFGYFDNARDELNAIKSMANNLKNGGKVVIDFFNPACVIHTINSQVITKEVDGIKFIINKKLAGKSILKNIHIIDKNKTFDYQEQVRLLTQSDFENYFKQFGLTTIAAYGDYTMKPYNDMESDRLILVAIKG